MENLPESQRQMFALLYQSVLALQKAVRCVTEDVDLAFGADAPQWLEESEQLLRQSASIAEALFVTQERA